MLFNDAQPRPEVQETVDHLRDGQAGATPRAGMGTRVNLRTFLPAGLDKDGPWKNPPGSQARTIWKWPLLTAVSRREESVEALKSPTGGNSIHFPPRTLGVFAQISSHPNGPAASSL